MNLRTQALRGGMYLAIRQGMSIALGIVGVLFLTKTIGPDQYGLYAAAIGLYSYTQNVSQLGVAVYLVRRKGEESLAVFHQAFTLLLLLGFGGMLIGVIGHPLLQSWVRLDGFGLICQVLFLGIPFSLLRQVATAKLERDLNYKQIAIIEFWNHLFYYVIALPLAFQGFGAWAPVAGWLAQEVQGTILFYAKAKYRPQLCWNPELIKQMLTYSVSYSASVWVWQLRSLINPLIVGPYAGAEAVGYVALAIRFTDNLSFVRRSTFRISIATLARIQNEPARLLKAVSEGSRLQILALAPFLAMLAWIGPWMMPLIFGDNWLPVMEVFPFIALSYLVNATFNLHASTLYVVQRNWEVTVFHIVHIILFAGSALLLIPKYGIIGYGWAELVAIFSYFIIHIYFVKTVGNPDYRIATLWCVAFSLSLFVHQLGYWAVSGVIAIFIWPETHRQIGNYLTLMRKAKA
jgi:PST family polysaccharide transporter